MECSKVAVRTRGNEVMRLCFTDFACKLIVINIELNIDYWTNSVYTITYTENR